MQVVCWNINVRKNNPDDFPYKEVCDALKPLIDVTEAWLLVVLENKSRGSALADELAMRLKATLGGQLNVGCASHLAGGGPHTTENMLFVGAGCEVAARCHHKWRAPFEEILDEAKKEYRRGALDLRERYRIKSRASTRIKTHKSIDEIRLWKASNCRDPIVASIDDSAGENWEIAFVHAPGPQESPAALRLIYSELYFQTIMASMSEHEISLDGVFGDFNLYGRVPKRQIFPGMVDLALHKLQPAPVQAPPPPQFQALQPPQMIGQPTQQAQAVQQAPAIAALRPSGTTFKRSTGEVGTSRLDRIYVQETLADNARFGIVNGTDAASDHVGLFARISR